MKRNNALSLIERVQSLISNSTGSDPRAKKDIDDILAELINVRSAGDAVSQKVAMLQTWVAAYFSLKKHRQYGGPDRLKNMMLTECQKMRRVLIGSGHPRLAPPTKERLVVRHPPR